MDLSLFHLLDHLPNQPAPFFLELLPSAFGDMGSPANLAFLKQRLECNDELSFTVGVIFEPNPSAKKWQFKDHLPPLAEHIVTVYIEATPSGTVAQLLQKLQQRFPDLAVVGDLSDAISQLREGQGIGAGQKVLLILDQFQEWLHTKQGLEDADLAQALEKFDGQKVQALVIVQKKAATPPGKVIPKQADFSVLRGLAFSLLLVVAILAALSIHGRNLEREREAQARDLVSRLLNTNIAQVPFVLAEVPSQRPRIDPLLKDAYAEAETQNDSGKQLRASLAMLPDDSGQVAYLFGRLLDAQPQELPILREALQDHKKELHDRLWAAVEQPDKSHEKQRLRAAFALAAYDPQDLRWQKVAGPVVDQLVAESPLYLPTFIEGFRPIKSQLIGPLAVIYKDRREGRAPERNLATDILTDYASDQPSILADLLMEADERQFVTLFPKFKDQRSQISPFLVSELNRQTASISNLPAVPEEAREALAQRQGNAAVALLKMDQAQHLWPLLKETPDPRLRSYLIHRLASLGAEPELLVQRLDEEKEPSIRQALLLSLGEFQPGQLSPSTGNLLIPKIVQLYRDESDPGIHGAARWLLLKWQENHRLDEIDGLWASDQPWRKGRLNHILQGLEKDPSHSKPQWFVNGQGQTMVVIPGPVEFLMGSPPTENGRDGGPGGELEKQHPKRLARSFAIADREVNVIQFHQFRPDQVYNQQYAPSGDCPANDVSWYDAAAYCNWLSKQEGFAEDQWCYLPNSAGEFAEGMKQAPNFLQRTGYRLPTEAEWEAACRSGTLTSRFQGATENLLGQYAWYTRNSLDRVLLPAGSLKPNGLGLFDILGNAVEWCQDPFLPYTGDLDDKQEEGDIKNNQFRVLRGGSFYARAAYVRSASRNWNLPGSRGDDVGFRPARTLR